MTMVTPRTTQTESMATTQGQILLKKSVPISEEKDGIDNLTRELANGQALLRVVAYPWGVEFEVCRLEGEP